MKRSVVLIAHNLRSCHNVGSLLRTAEGLGLDTVYLTGYTPYPILPHDKRMPHIANKIHRQINKTALGAEDSLKWIQNEDISPIINDLRQNDYIIVSLEQTNAIDITTWMPPEKIALIVGRETEGIEPEILKMSDVIVEIPMSGKKESFNVVQAAAMSLFYCKFSK
jgi:23S rRNA (guanosine2251-2'-O)-methyltransferase